MMSAAGDLIRYEDTVLHDLWKAGGGGDTFLGSIVTNEERAAKVEYVKLANVWLTRTTAALSSKSGSQAELATLERLFTKILERRDELVAIGYGSPSAAGEDVITQWYNKLAPTSKDGIERSAKWAALGLVALLLIVILK